MSSGQVELRYYFTAIVAKYFSSVANLAHHFKKRQNNHLP